MNLPKVELQAGDHLLLVHVARTAEERAQGLMYRREMAPDEGMLFMCERGIQKFWMKDTPLALSIAFVEDDGTLLQIEDMEPTSHEGCSSNDAVRWVLEVNQGWFRERGIAPGQRLSGPPFLA